ncbi:Zinc finger C2H2-type [Trinorchestia longiramus]|nr:Zinc finger C2H2-type [Trinorchestia longiramus]
MKLGDHQPWDALCVVCERCNVGKVLKKQQIGDRVTDLSKTPLTELLSSLLKEVVTEDMMLCMQCLKCLNKKDKLMVFEKHGLGPGCNPRGSRGRGKGAPRVSQAGAPTDGGESSRGRSSKGKGRGRGRKASSSNLDFSMPDNKVPRPSGSTDEDGKPESGLAGASVPEHFNHPAVPCITAIKDEALSDDENQQTTEICFNSDTVVATTTPQCPRDLLTPHAGEPFNCDLIKSEITVDGDDCVVGLRCIDETKAPSAAVHVVSSIDGPLPAAQCPSPPPSLSDESTNNAWEPPIPSSLAPPVSNSSVVSASKFSAASASISSAVSVANHVSNSSATPVTNSSSVRGLLYDAAVNSSVTVPTKTLSNNTVTLCATASFNVTVDAASIRNIPWPSSDDRPGLFSTASSIEEEAPISKKNSSKTASFLAPSVSVNPVLLPRASEGAENEVKKWANIATFQIGNGTPQIINLTTEKQVSSHEEETTYVDMPEILAFPDGEAEDLMEGANMNGTESSQFLSTADGGRLPRAELDFVGGSVFPCNLCSSSFPTAGSLRHHHEQAHNKLKRAQCLSCSFYSPELAEVEDHMRNEHQIESQHFCNFCEATFILKASYLYHMKIIHKVKKPKIYEKAGFSSVYWKEEITCPHCEAPFENTKTLMAHNDQVHNGQKFSCKYCSFKCISYKTLARHDADKHKAKSEYIYTCAECKNQFNSEVALEKHCNDEHDLMKTHSCKKCGAVFITDVMLRFHEATHNSYRCQICNCGFKKRESYDAHLKNVHNYDHPRLMLEEVPSITDGVPSLQVSDTPAVGDRLAEVLMSPTNVLQLSSNFTLVEENSSDSVGAPRQYDEDVAEEYLKQLRGTPNNQKVPCVFCYKEVTAGHLRTHFKNHSGVTPYTCDFCNKDFIQSTNLRKHVRSKHPEHFQNWDSSSKIHKKKSVACELCGKVFEGVDECEVHLWEHMSSKDHECSLCKTRFGSENNLKEHMKTHYFEEPRECQFCKGRTFKIIGFYNDHVENCRNQWTCPTCGLCLRNENKFRKHQKSAHSGSDIYKFVCPEPGCGKKFFERHRYDDHCITHESERRYQCPHCSKKFKRLRPMNEHIKDKHNGFRCNACEKSFISLDQLVQHRTKSHSSDFRECPECALVFANDATFVNHTRCYHPDDDVFEIPQCHICNELCSNEAEMSTHFTEHQKGSYICCSFGCYSSAPCEDDFRDHLSAEHADLDYECVYCQSDQLNEAALRRHYVDSHGKERQCEVCTVPFYKDDHLQRHASQHSEDSKYLCDACEFTCNNRYWMVAHLKNSHYVSSEDLKGCVVQQRVYGCSLCATLTVTIEEMTQHVLTHETTDHPEIASLRLPTRIESNSIHCPVCNTPWPDQSTIIEHLQSSKSCTKQLSQLNRSTQNEDNSSTGQVEVQVKNENYTETPNDIEFVVFPKAEDDKSNATLVEVHDEEYLAKIRDAMITPCEEGSSANATVVELDGDHYFLWKESENEPCEPSDQQQSSIISAGHLTTDSVESLGDLHPLSAELAMATTPIILDEEDFAALLNKSDQFTNSGGFCTT